MPSRRGRLIVAVAFVAGVVVATLMARLAFDRQAETKTPDLVNPHAVSVPSAEPPPTSLSPAVMPRPAAAAPAPSVPASISLPAGVRWPRAVEDGVPNTILAISPDGRRIVFSARTEEGTSLWIRSLAIDDARQLAGTEGGISPFWSPDSAAIGFFADRKLKRLDVGGDAMPTTLYDVRTQRGGTWGPDNTIVFSPFSGALKRISAKEGPVTPLGAHDDDAAHVRPQFLAGTRQILYRVTSRNGRNNLYYVTSLDSTDRKLIGTFDSGNVTYSHGHLLFMQNNTLMAQPFDPRRLTTTGPPYPIANRVLLSTGSLPVFGLFSASQTGRIVYLSQGGDYNDPLTVLSNWSDSPAGR